MVCRDNVDQASQEKITLEEILSPLLGKYVVIVLKEEQNTKQEERTARGVLKVTEHKLVIIGEESYKLDTPVTGVLQIEDIENKTPLC